MTHDAFGVITMKNEQTSRARALISRGREKGRVVHFSEAFRNYPVEDEEHKGKIEYWTQERETDELSNR